MNGLYPLYIDPGTGSALFSIAVGVAATLYFFLRTLAAKAAVLVHGKQRAKCRQTGHAFVVYAEDKRYWPLFKPILDEFENRQTALLYLTSSEDDPVFEAGYQSIKPEMIGRGNRAYARLNVLVADVVLTSTPGLDVYQWKRSRGVKSYVYIPHFVTEFLTLTMFDLDYFDCVLLTGSHQEADLRAIEKLWSLPEKKTAIVGCTYLDDALKKKRALSERKTNDGKRTVLVAPSWGKSALLSLYGETLLNELVKTGYEIIVRPHPQSSISEKPLLQKLQTVYAGAPNLTWNYDDENIQVLSRADIVISDFSGINFDYMFLFDRPVIYANMDFDPRQKDAHFVPDRPIWQFDALRKTGIELQRKDFPSIKEIIDNAINNAELTSVRHKLKQEAWMFCGEAGKRTADFLINENTLLSIDRGSEC